MQRSGVAGLQGAFADAAEDAVRAAAGGGVGWTGRAPTGGADAGTGIADQGGTVGSDAAAGDDFKAIGVVVEAKEVSNGTGRQSGHVGVCDANGRIEGRAGRLQRLGKDGGNAIWQGHRDTIVMNLIEKEVFRIGWTGN